MKILVIVVCSCSLFIGVICQAEDWPTTRALKNLKDEWGIFKAKNDKKYASLEEELCRYEIYNRNRQDVERNNIKKAWGKTTFTMKMNSFGDREPKEVGHAAIDVCKNPTEPRAPVDLKIVDPQTMLNSALDPKKTQFMCTYENEETLWCSLRTSIRK